MTSYLGGPVVEDRYHVCLSQARTAPSTWRVASLLRVRGSFAFSPKWHVKLWARPMWRSLAAPATSTFVSTDTDRIRQQGVWYMRWHKTWHGPVLLVCTTPVQRDSPQIKVSGAFHPKMECMLPNPIDYTQHVSSAARTNPQALLEE